ncbi:hypothetical protein NQ317_011338, partial [Molorchus minor]
FVLYVVYGGTKLQVLREVGDKVRYNYNNLSADIIKRRDDNEKHISEKHFINNGFPNIIGAIDRSHIIDKPSNDPDSYINRKGFSIQMQEAVCDHRRKIRSVFIGYRGPVHDSRWLSPLQGNLLTPYNRQGNLTRRQTNYNVKLAKNRIKKQESLVVLLEGQKDDVIGPFIYLCINL